MTTLELSIMIAVPAFLLLLCIFLAVNLIKLKIHKKTKTIEESHVAIQSQSRLDRDVNNEKMHHQSKFKDKQQQGKPRKPHKPCDEPLTDEDYILQLKTQIAKQAEEIAKLNMQNKEAQNKLSSAGKALGRAIKIQREVQEALKFRYTAVKINSLDKTLVFKFTGVAEDRRIENLFRAINSKLNESAKPQNKSNKRGEVQYCKAMQQTDFQKQLEYCNDQLVETLELPEQLPKHKILVFAVNTLPNGEYNFQSEHFMSLTELLLTLKKQQQTDQGQLPRNQLAAREKVLLSNMFRARQLHQTGTYLTPDDFSTNTKPSEKNTDASRAMTVHNDAAGQRARFIGNTSNDAAGQRARFIGNTSNEAAGQRAR